MNPERKEKVISYIEKKRAEGKLDLNCILALIDSIEQKTRDETYTEVLGFVLDLQRGNSGPSK